VHVSKSHASLNPQPSPFRIEINCFHQLEVDHQSAIAQGSAGDVMTSASNCHLDPALTRKAHRGDNVIIADATREYCRPLLNASVPDLADLLVLGITDGD